MSRWNSYFMDVAVRTSQLSYCKRMQVGAVIVRDRRIICTGYNGTPPGSDNCCEFIDSDHVEKTKPDVLHAEENAILFAAKYGLSLCGCSIYVTHAPCINCARMIHGSGISELVYKQIYRCDEGLRYLQQTGVNVLQLM